jgi:hypothetical protein
MKTKATVKVEFLSETLVQDKLGSIPTIKTKIQDALVILPEGTGNFSAPVTALMQTKSVVSKMVMQTGGTTDALGDCKIIVSAYDDEGMVAFQWDFTAAAGEIFNDSIFHNHLVPAAEESYANAHLTYTKSQSQEV